MYFQLIFSKEEIISITCYPTQNKLKTINNQLNKTPSQSLEPKPLILQHNKKIKNNNCKQLNSI